MTEETSLSVFPRDCPKGIAEIVPRDCPKGFVEEVVPKDCPKGFPPKRHISVSRRT